MNIETICRSLHALNTKYQSVNLPESLQDKIQLAYSKWVLNRLKPLFKESMWSLAGRLELFLNDNWSLVNGTPLSPTALPTNDIILFLCDIAEWTARHLKGKTPIALLMPTIATESFRTGYPDLTVSSTIQDVLKTHVLGLGGFYLLPVTLLTELQLSAETIRLANPYYDYQIHPETAGYVNHDEYIRLIGHSELTQALIDARQDYELLTSDTNTLLGQLKQLCQRLGFNSAYAVGTEDDAGIGAYPALIYFMDYFIKLPDSGKEKIPTNLKQEIYTLIELSTNRDINRKATEIMETCIATRRSELIKYMMGHEVLLNKISLSQLENTNLIEKAKLRFEEAKRALLDAMASHMYLDGRDTLGLNIELFKKLNVPIKIRSSADLELFQKLTPAEITTLCGNSEFRHQIIHHIETIENLVIFITELSPDNLKSFLNAMARELKRQFLASYRDLSMLLISLDVEKCHIVCEGLQDLLPDIFKGFAKGSHLAHILFALLPQQRTAVCQAMKNVFPLIIHCAEDLRDILREAPLENYVVIIQSINLSNVLAPKLGSRYKVSESANLLALAKQFSPQQCVEILKIIGFKRFETEFQPSDLLQLSTDQFSLVRQAINEEMLEYSASTDLNALFSTLTLKQCAMACIARQQFFSKMTISDFSHLLCSLSTDKIFVICQMVPLNSILKSPSNIAELISALSPEQCDCIDKELFRHVFFDSVINSIQILQLLSLDKRTLIYEKNKLLFNIDSVSDFIEFVEIMTLFPEPQSTDLFKRHSKWLPTIIKSVEHLELILRSLSLKHNIMVLQEMKNRLPKLISSSLDFAKACSYLSSEACEELCQKMCDTLPNLILSADDIRIMTPYFISDKAEAMLPVLGLPYLMNVLKTTTSDTLAAKMTSAFLSNDNERIKRVLDQLIQHDHSADVRFFSYFKYAKPKLPWIDVLPRLDVYWLEKINIALELDLTNLQSRSLIEIKHALEVYFTGTNLQSFENKPI